MIRRFEKWFDSISDGWNPITVRELRRSVRSGELIAITTFLLIGFVIIHFCCDETHLVGTGARTVLTCIMLLTSIADRIGRMRDDDNFATIPLTPKEKVDGFLQSSCLISAFFLIPSLPFLAFFSGISFRLLFQLGILLGCFFVVQTITLLFFSFMVRATDSLEDTFFGPVLGIYLGTFGPCFIAWLFWLKFFNRPITTLFFYVAIGGAIAAVLSLGYVAYRLSPYHYSRHFESARRASLLNFGVYWLWSVCWIAVAFAAGWFLL